jgi:hypothetical protein
MKEKKKATKIGAFNFVPLMLLSACGGGVTQKPQEPVDPDVGPDDSETVASGRVIDGYIQNARVFADLNDNLRLDSGEPYVLTSSEGLFENLNASGTNYLAVSNNLGQATDASTGFALGFSMAAPLGYETITPITTLVVGLIENGMEQVEAEQTIKHVFNIPADIDLSNFDPFESLLNSSATADEKSRAEEYQLVSMKVANIFLLSDENYTNTNEVDFKTHVLDFSNVLIEKAKTNTDLNLADQADLLLILPEMSQSNLAILTQLNSHTTYDESLDAQLVNYSSNPAGELMLEQGASEYLIAIQISGTLVSENYRLILQNSDGSVSVSSSDVVSVGNSVVIFRFSAEQIADLGIDALTFTIEDLATGEVLTSITETSIVDGDDTNTETSGVQPVYIPPTADGTVVDGYIENARVFRDLNDNDQWDDGEPFVITGELGVFSGLTGDINLPIKVDSNAGAAVDVGTGDANDPATPFTGLLSAPGGSAVVTPITTVIHEVMKASSVTVEQANARVAKLLSLETAGGEPLVDLTKFEFDFSGNDEVSNKVFTKTSFVGSAILGTAKQAGNNANDQATAALNVAKKFAELAANESPTAISFDADALLDVMVQVTGLSPSDPLITSTTDTFEGGDVLTPVQISTAARSIFDEFSDGFLTSDEAADGTTLTIGPTETTMNGNYAIKITSPGGGVHFDHFQVSNDNYGYLDISADALTSNLNAGELTITVKDNTSGNLATVDSFDDLANTNTIINQSKTYFYKDIYPVVVINTNTVAVPVVNGEARINANSTDLSLSGSVRIDVGTAGIPASFNDDITKFFVGGPEDGNGFSLVYLEFKDGNGDVVHIIKAAIQHDTVNSTDTVGVFNWSASGDDFSGFDSIPDGPYTVLASFTDALGASNLHHDDRTISNDTFTNLIVDKAVPDISKSESGVYNGIEIPDFEISIGEQVEYTVTFSEPIFEINEALIELQLGSADNVVLLNDQTVSHNWSAGATSFTILYTPTGQLKDDPGLDLVIKAGAITDASGNPNGSDVVASNVVENGAVKYDMTSPEIASIQIINASSQSIDTVTTATGALDLRITSSEPLQELDLSNVSIVADSGRSLFNPLSFLSDGNVHTSSLQLLSNDINLDDTFNVVVRDVSDTFGNVLVENVQSADFTLDATNPQAYSVQLIDAKQVYGDGDAIKIQMVFDQKVFLATGRPSIPLELQSGTVYAELDASTIDTDNGSTSVTFEYTVTNEDTSGSDAVGVGSEITDYPDTTSGALFDQNGNPVETDLSIAEVSLTTLGGRVVEGGNQAAAADGYIDGAIIYADNNTPGFDSQDPVAQTDPTGGFVIYGAAGPLVMEGGFDISTNKDFNVRYKAPSDSAIINPVTTLIVSHPASVTDPNGPNYATEDVYGEIGSPLGDGADDYLRLLQYNPYEAIGVAVDLATIGDVQAAVDEGLAFQKIAASVALVADFAASSLDFVRVSNGAVSNIAAIGDDVFSAIAGDLENFISAIGGDFDNYLVDYYDTDTAIFSNQANVDTLAGRLETILNPLDDMTELAGDFTDAGEDFYDIIANAIVAIHNAAPEYTGTDKFLASEDGINKLTEIVQVQKVVQNNMLRALERYYEDLVADPDNAVFPSDVSVAGLLGTEELKVYLQEPVGTVVPIRYSIDLKDTTPDSIFEGDADGSPNVLQFTVTRSGSIKTQSTVEYEIFGDVTADDISGSSLSGELFFDVNITSMDIVVEMNNDDIREGLETLIVEISDPTQTAQITNNRISAEIKDDDPSVPELSIERVSYDLSEGETIALDDIALDYFDPNAFFSINSQLPNASGSTQLTSGGADLSENAYVSAFDFNTDVLRNVSFVAEGLGEDVTETSAIFFISAAETYANSTAGGRQSQAEINVDFTIHRTPILNIDSLTITSIEQTAIAGKAIVIDGVLVTDVDSETVDVSVSSNISGEFELSNFSDVSQTLSEGGTLKISGSTENVQSALSGMTFIPDDAGNFVLNLSIDDGDLVHDRTLDGALKSTSLNSKIQVDSLDLAISNAIISALTGVDVGDADGDRAYNLTTVTHGVSSDGLYVVKGSDADGWSAYEVTNEQAPYEISETADVGNPFVVAAAPPEIEQNFVPNLRYGPEIWNKFSGVSVFDFDTDAGLTLTITSDLIDVTPQLTSQILDGLSEVDVGDAADDLAYNLTTEAHYVSSDGLYVVRGSDLAGWTAFEVTGAATPYTVSETADAGTQIPGANFQLVDISDPLNPVVTTKANGFTIVGSTDEINSKLTQLEVNILVDDTSLISFSISDGENTEVVLQAEYVATQNAVPDPGGDIQVGIEGEGSVTEDSGAQQVVVSGITLSDEDGEPTQIKVIGFNGGTPSVGGIPLIDNDGVQTPLTVGEGGSVIFDFNPDTDFSGQANIEYVVIDADDASTTSAPSKISIEVLPLNDAPEVFSNNQAANYYEGSEPVRMLSDLTFEDIDSSKISEIRIRGDLPEGATLVAPDLYGFSETSEAGVFKGPNSISIKSAREYLSKIKFYSTSEDLTTSSELRSKDLILNVSVTDEEGATSAEVQKVVRLFDINDAPEFVWSNPDASITITENNEGLVVGSAELGSITDPENDSILQLKLQITQGYSAAVDSFGISNTIREDERVAVTEDQAAGALTLTSISEDGLEIEVFSQFLEGISYFNSSDNPASGPDKNISLTITDVNGASQTSLNKQIIIDPENDAPSIFSLVAGARNLTGGDGEQFIVSGQSARIAPNIDIVDIDDALVSEARLTVDSNELAVNGVLSLSASGEFLATANGLVFEAPADTEADYYRITSETAIAKVVLQNVLREVVFSYTPTEESPLESDTQQFVSIIVNDGEDNSNEYIASVALLTAPSVQVTPLDNAVLSEAFSLGDGTPSVGAIKAKDASFENVLKFNESFTAGELRVDLQTSSIRTEAGRFVYDLDRNELDVSKGGHIDISEMSGEEDTVTVIYGQQRDENIAQVQGNEANYLYSDWIKGSDFADFVDGRGGYDVIQLGIGSDILVYRAGANDNGSVYDGGDGLDTLLLPVDFDGDAVSLSTLSSNAVVVANFENIDASPVLSGVTIEGDVKANVLIGGGFDDIIKLGPGGDTAKGGAGSDIFEVDLSQIDPTSNVILDLSRNDAIKILNGGEIYTIDDWSGVSTKVLATAGNGAEAWISETTSGGGSNYFLNIEADDAIDGGSVVTIDIGTSIYGTPAKWLSTDGDGYSIIQPVLNSDTYLSQSGIFTSKSQRSQMAEHETDAETGEKTYRLNLTQSQFPQVADADGDDLTLSLSLVTTAGNTNATNVDYTFDEALVREIEVNLLTGTIDGINDVIQSLEITSDEAIEAKVTISVTDGYSDAPQVIKNIFVTSPNTAPVLEMEKVGGSDDNLTINDKITLSTQNLVLNIFDQDTIDKSGALTVKLDVKGGLLEYTGDQQQYVSTSATGLIIEAADGSVIQDWTSLIENIVSDIEVSREAAGTTTLALRVTDSAGQSVSGSFNLSFSPTAPSLPELFIYGEPVDEYFASLQEDSRELSQAEFSGASVRVATNSLGARIGDTLEFYTDETSLGGDLTEAALSIVLKASAVDPERIQPFVEIPFGVLFPNQDGSGNFPVIPVLKATGFDPIFDVNNQFSIDVDATAPEVPVISTINGNPSITTEDGQDYFTGFTNQTNGINIEVTGDIEPNLRYSLAQTINGSEKKWYDIENITQSDFMSLATGKLRSPIELTVGEPLEGVLKLTYQGVLEPGMYSLFATDLVGNVSEYRGPLSWDDVSLTNYFVIDNEIDTSGLGIISDVAETAKTYLGGDRVRYTINQDLAHGIPINFGNDVDKDVIKIDLDVYYEGSLEGDAEADISATLTRDFGASDWASDNPLVTLESYDQVSGPTFSINLMGDDGRELDATNIRFNVAFEDYAGNVGNIASDTDVAKQFTLDFYADEGDAIVQQATEALLTGISIPELDGIIPNVQANMLERFGETSFTLSNVDLDFARVNSYYLTGSQLLDFLEPIAGAATLTSAEGLEVTDFYTDPQTQEKFAMFSIGESHYYLDFPEVFYTNVTDIYGRTNSDMDEDDRVGVDDLKWVGNVTIGGHDFAEYIHVEDFDVYEEQSVYLLTEELHGVSSNGQYVLEGSDALGWSAFAVSGAGTLGDPYVISRVIDTGDLTMTEEGLSGLEREFSISSVNKYLSNYVVNAFDSSLIGGMPPMSQILAPITPEQDDLLFSINKVMDKAGNIAFTSGFEVDGEFHGALTIDVTDPDRAVIKVERASSTDGQLTLDYWDTVNDYTGENGLRFSLESIADGDVVNANAVNVNGVDAIKIDPESDLFFIGRDALVDAGTDGTVLNVVEYSVTEISGNTKVFTETFAAELDQPENQYFEVTPVAYTKIVDNIEEDFVRFDIYVSDQALEEAEINTVSIFEGTSFDLKVVLPNSIISTGSDDIILLSNELFDDNGAISEYSYDAATGIVRWSGISLDEPDILGDPLLTIEFNVEDFSAINEVVDNVSLSISKISDWDITENVDIFNLSYEVDLTGLLLAPLEFTI